MACRIADSKAPGTTKKACRTSVGVRWRSFRIVIAAGAISEYSIARKDRMAQGGLSAFDFYRQKRRDILAYLPLSCLRQYEE